MTCNALIIRSPDFVRGVSALDGLRGILGNDRRCKLEVEIRAKRYRCILIDSVAETLTVTSSEAFEAPSGETVPLMTTLLGGL